MGEEIRENKSMIFGVEKKTLSLRREKLQMLEI